MVLCMIGKDLTTKMKADEAMLLSTLYESFLKKVYTESKKYTSLDPVGKSKIPQKRWVMSQLYCHLVKSLPSHVGIFVTVLFSTIRIVIW